MMSWLKKLLTAKGTDSTFTSLGVMGPVVAMVLLAVNTWWQSRGHPGNLVEPANLQLAITNVIAVVGFVVGICGRVRAQNVIGGSGATLKLVPFMFAAVLAGGMLQGCGQVQSAKDWWAQQTPAEKAALIVAGVHTTCGVSIKVADVTSAVTQDPVATTVDGTIKAICDQIDVAGKIQALTPSECVATVNGVCIHKDG